MRFDIALDFGYVAASFLIAGCSSSPELSGVAASAGEGGFANVSTSGSGSSDGGPLEAAGGGGGGLASDAGAPATQTIYMAVTGSDDADGSTPVTAVESLARVQTLVAAGPQDADVEVRIHAGTYVAGQVTWQTYRPGHTISFMPDDYSYGEGIAAIEARPVFENGKAVASKRYLPGYWFYACAGASGQPLSEGGTSGLRFYYLEVRHFSSGGISLDGSAGSCGGGYHASSPPGEPSARGLDENTIIGMRFFELGNQYTGGLCDDPNWPRCGYGGVVLTESSHNRIANNVFENLINQEQSYIHAVYVTHKSSSNEFSGNSVKQVSSDPVKVRDASNFNKFDSNVFDQNDFPRMDAAHYLEQANTMSDECASYHNRFTNNDLGTYRTGSANLPAWYLTGGDATWAGSVGCPPLPAGEVRLTTAGNAY
jgi:hypothetical protein